MVVTYAQLYRQLTTRLTTAECDSPAFEARCLLTDIGKLPPKGLPVADERPVDDEIVRAVNTAAEERVAGRPLQYILGKWDFLRLTLSVGEGVLVPRPDTEILCETAATWLDTHPTATPARMLDLCAGSGCVGLGTASLCRRALAVTAVEWSSDALRYLKENLARYPQYAVEAVRADVLHDAGHFPDGVDALLSNPPYIPTGDLDGLMREVQHEPRMALDGDVDGLQFYRAIATDWVPKLVPGGLCAVEIGIGQADAVAALFTAVGLQNIRILPDLAGISRVVMGEAPKTV